MRFRFAPSPTGVLHIGSARTALYNWLAARHAGATFLLRIEDTDRERSTPETVDQILDALEWLGIDWDEEPIFQSQRLERHTEVVQQLLDSGHAYRSTAGPAEVKAFKEKYGNERGFRGEDEGKGAVRLRIPDSGATIVHDVIRGETAFEHEHLDDLVIARADGSPVYHLAVVVDDLDSGITHVVRGVEHYSNTPKQLQIIEALSAVPPVYAHLPLLHGTDGRKLSKRHGAASVQELRTAGYLPEAIRNYLSLLGWGYDDSTTFFSTDELIKHFTLERVSKSPAVFDEQKLRWMNGRYVRSLPTDQLAEKLENLTGQTNLEPVIGITQDKISTLAEFWPLTRFFFEGPADDAPAREKFLGSQAAIDRLRAAQVALAAVGEWNRDQIEAALREVVSASDCKPKEVFQPIRVAVAGVPVSPGIFETLEVLGRDETLKRLDSAIADS